MNEYWITGEVTMMHNRYHIVPVRVKVRAWDEEEALQEINVSLEIQGRQWVHPPDVSLVSVTISRSGQISLL
jgi:hypothetical protein